MPRYLLNALSPSMFNRRSTILIEPIDLETARRRLENGFISAVGHESTAKLLTNLLGIAVVKNRIAVTLEDGDTAIIVVLGFRPEEGKVYSLEELEKLYRQGRIKLYYAEVKQP